MTAPRRLLRALAGGFGRAETLYVLGFLLRAVFWKKREGCITVDGRMKGSWLAETFSLSRRAVTGARQRLIELGWIRPLEVHQRLANRYGVHDVVNVDWSPEEGAHGGAGVEPGFVAGAEGGAGALDPEAGAAAVDPVRLRAAGQGSDPVENSAVVGGGSAGGSASPEARSAGGSASPINQKAPSTKEFNTRRLGVDAPDPASGVCRKDGGGGGASGRPPSLRDVQRHDLRDTERLLELHGQAVEAGFDVRGESGRMDFLALANRALCRGQNPGGLLRWLLANRKLEFITQADEDAAAARLRAHIAGPRKVPTSVGELDRAPRAQSAAERRGLTGDELFVELCLRGVKRHRGVDPFLVAERGKGWTRERWDRVRASYERKQAEQWMGGEEWE